MIQVKKKKEKWMEIEVDGGYCRLAFGSEYSCRLWFDLLISDVFVTMSHRALPVGILLDVPIHFRSNISSTHCQTLPTQVSPLIRAISEILWKISSCEGALPSMTMKARFLDYRLPFVRFISWRALSRYLDLFVRHCRRVKTRFGSQFSRSLNRHRMKVTYR